MYYLTIISNGMRRDLFSDSSIEALDRKIAQEFKSFYDLKTKTEYNSGIPVDMAFITCGNGVPIPIAYIGDIKRITDYQSLHIDYVEYLFKHPDELKTMLRACFLDENAFLLRWCQENGRMRMIETAEKLLLKPTLTYGKGINQGLVNGEPGDYFNIFNITSIILRDSYLYHRHCYFLMKKVSDQGIEPPIKHTPQSVEDLLIPETPESTSLTTIPTISELPIINPNTEENMQQTFFGGEVPHNQSGRKNRT